MEFTEGNEVNEGREIYAGIVPSILGRFPGESQLFILERKMNRRDRKDRREKTTQRD